MIGRRIGGLLLALVSAVACSSSTKDDETKADGGHTSASGGSAGAEGEVAGRTSTGGVSESGSGGVTSGGQASGGQASGGVPQEDPSLQTVSFDVANRTSSEIYLVTDGSDCYPYEVEQSSTSERVILGVVGGDCPCGWACDYAATSHIEALAPGETRSLTWDARGLVIHQTMVSCEPEFHEAAWNPVGVPYRVTPDRYQVTVGFLLTSTGAGGLCDSPSTVDSGPARRCCADALVTAEFELPATGDVSVPIEVDDLVPIWGD